MNSIQGRLTAIALLFIVGISIVVSIVGFRLTISFEKDRFREHFDLLASYLANNAELGVMLDNKKILQDLVKNMLVVRDVQSVEIVRPGGEILAKMTKQGGGDTVGVVSQPIRTHTMEPLDAPFVSSQEQEKILGTVHISFTHEALEGLKRMLALQFSLVSLLLSCGAILLYWLLSRAIIAPLHGLLYVAAQVSQGRMSVRAQGGALAEIKTLATAINDMLDTLAQQRQKLNYAHEAMAQQKVLAEVGRFSMIVAHEIKNPLAIIKGSLDVLSKEEMVDVPTKKRLVGFANEEILRINKLVEDFLLFSRPHTPEFRMVAVKSIATSLSHRLKHLEENTNIRMHFSALSVEREFLCDMPLLERALFNVVRNAVDVSKPDDGVDVKGYCSKQWLVFTVADGGPGINPKDRDHIFEPFFSTKAKGTGLGLAIVKDIMRLHGGEIVVTNRRAGGALCTLSVPLDRVKKHADSHQRR